MKVPGSKIVPCQGVLGSNHSLTFGLFTQVSGLGPLGPLVLLLHFVETKWAHSTGSFVLRDPEHEALFSSSEP